MKREAGSVLISINDIGPVAAELTIGREPEHLGDDSAFRSNEWRAEAPHFTARQMRRLQALIEAGIVPPADQPVEVRIHGDGPWVYSGRAWMTAEPHDMREPENCYAVDLRGVGPVRLDR